MTKYSNLCCIAIVIGGFVGCAKNGGPDPMTTTGTVKQTFTSERGTAEVKPTPATISVALPDGRRILKPGEPIECLVTLTPSNGEPLPTFLDVEIFKGEVSVQAESAGLKDRSGGSYNFVARLEAPKQRGTYAIRAEADWVENLISSDPVSGKTKTETKVARAFSPKLTIQVKSR